MLPTEKQLIESIDKIDYYPLKFKGIKPLLKTIKGNINYYQPDGFINLEWQGEEKDFVIEIKRVFNTKEVEDTLIQIKKYIPMWKDMDKKEYFHENYFYNL